MNKSKRLNYSELRERVERSHQMVVGQTQGLGTIKINLLVKYNAWLMQELLNKELEDFGLSASAYIAMTMINGSTDHTANPSDLSLCTGETRANMTRICDDLVAQGLLQRVTSPVDRRRIDMSLTEKGLDLLRRVVPKVREKNRKVFSVFSDDEREVLEKSLLKLLVAIESNV
jgi:MarR family transcriptional repressor of emrRAB